MPQKKPVVPDFIIIGLAVLAAAMIFVMRHTESGMTFTVETPKSTISYRLDEDRVFCVESEGFTLKIEVREGSVRVSESDCPDGICEASGWISDSGEAIVCVPAKTVISIDSDTGGAGNEDFIVG